MPLTMVSFLSSPPRPAMLLGPSPCTICMVMGRWDLSFDARSPAHLHEAPGPLAGAAAPAAGGAMAGWSGAQMQISTSASMFPRMEAMFLEAMCNGWESHAFHPPPPASLLFCPGCPGQRGQPLFCPDLAIGPEKASSSSFSSSSSSSIRLCCRPDRVLGKARARGHVRYTMVPGRSVSPPFPLPLLLLPLLPMADYTHAWWKKSPGVKVRGGSGVILYPPQSIYRNPCSTLR